jgi:thioredoxin 1
MSKVRCLETTWNKLCSSLLQIKQQMAVEKLTDSDFEAALAGNEKVIIKFFADWCGSCKLISPKFNRLSGDERFAGVRFVEVNAEENQVARKKAGVSNLPFFATFKNGVLMEAHPTSKEEAIVGMLTNLN